ncbi:MAG: AMP-binding protein, partial [Pirellulaceae bacterium]|nr:AMP-binding protein [Pirellulaceae bacterium]
MSEHEEGQVHTVMVEQRLFPPNADFATQARIKSLAEYEELYKRSMADTEAFWAAEAREHLHWFKPCTKDLTWNEPNAEWFSDGLTNASANCLDVHIENGRGDRRAIIWEGEPGDTRELTYAQLHKEVCRAANMLKSLGVRPGDVVSIYMPMTPELAIAMLACARIGAV